MKEHWTVTECACCAQDSSHLCFTTKNATVPPTLLVLAAMSIAAWGFMHINWHYAGPATAALTGRDRWVAMSQVMTAIGIGWGMTWLTYAGDYSRFVSRTVPSTRTWMASAAGQIIPVVWLGVLGASLATRNGEVDPGKMIVDNFGAMAIPVLLLVVHGPIATNILNVYSFSVSAQALDVKVSRRTLSVVVGILAMAAVIAFIYSSGIAETLDSWLSGVVGWTATWGAVMFVHYYILEPRRSDYSELCAPAHEQRIPMVNPRALVAFLLGVAATWCFMYGMVPALQGPAARALGGLDLSWLAGLLTSGTTYWLLMRNPDRAHAMARRTAHAAPPAN